MCNTNHYNYCIIYGKILIVLKHYTNSSSLQGTSTILQILGKTLYILHIENACSFICLATMEI